MKLVSNGIKFDILGYFTRSGFPYNYYVSKPNEFGKSAIFIVRLDHGTEYVILMAYNKLYYQKKHNIYYISYEGIRQFIDLLKDGA